MRFFEFSNYLQKLENTSKRLEITSILVDLFDQLTETETEKAVNLSLGYLEAPFKNVKFNIADKLMLRALENAAGNKDTQNIYDKTGDLGDTAYKIFSKTDSELQVVDVHKKLMEIALAEGGGSQDSKIIKLTELFLQLDKLSAKYVARIVLGTTRLGFSELTVIDALRKFLKGDKNTKEQLENTYSMHPDIGLIAHKLKSKGLLGIKDISIEVGVPILAQKCQRLLGTEEIIEKMGKVWAEFKFDGMRVQLHIDRKKEQKSTIVEQSNLFDCDEKHSFISTFTRNQEETTHQFPDLVQAAETQIVADSAILDGEAIAFDKKTGAFLPLQDTMQRKRKHNIDNTIKNIPLKYFVFDILYLNGESLLTDPLLKRRELLKKVIKKGDIIEVDSHLETADVNELTDFFEKAKEKHLEGIIAKKPNDAYQAGARSFSWVKLKRADTDLLQDTVDCVVLGYYYGKGVRSKFGIGGFLVGVYDTEFDNFKTVSKVGTGLKDEDFVYLKAEADKIKVDKQPSNVTLDKKFTPDVWVAPSIVTELGADELTRSADHSAGFALRFPRLIKFRSDKKASDATTVNEIKDMYKSQKRAYYKENV